MYETILYEVKNGTAIITLNRPEKLNSFNAAMHAELLKALKSAGRDKKVRSIMITGAGRAFCAGQDLSEVDGDTDYGDFLRASYNPLIEEMSRMEKPIVAAVNGTAAGAGFSLALAADIRIASEKASFMNAFIHVGLVPDSGNFYYLPRMVGHSKAMEFMLLGEKVSATEAKELGLVSKLFPADSWEQEAAAFAEKLAGMPTKTIGLIKRNLQQSWDATLSEVLEKEALAQRIAGMSKDHKEGVSAFLEKRPPRFSGK
ncbi:MAG TPA: enoyl-CoA hydratase-related protein, partial [Bacillaceae bacterium]